MTTSTTSSKTKLGHGESQSQGRCLSTGWENTLATLTECASRTKFDNGVVETIEGKIAECRDAVNSMEQQVEGHAANSERVRTMIKTWEMTRDKLNKELKTADKSGPDAKCSRYIQAQERLERINIMIEDWEDR